MTEHGVINGLTAGENKSDVVFRDFHDEARTFFVEVVDFHPAEKVGAAHGGEDDSVLYFAVAYFPWRQ